MGSRHSSYNSHVSRMSYTSHELFPGCRGCPLSTSQMKCGSFMGHPMTKESQLLQRAKQVQGDPSKGFYNEGLTGSLDDLSTCTAKALSMEDVNQPSQTVPEAPEAVKVRSVTVTSAAPAAAPPGDGGGDETEGEEGEEQERLPLKEIIKAKIKEVLLELLDIFCLWDCGFPYSVFKKVVTFVIFDAFMELFITLAIVVNVVFMALDHYGLEEKVTMSAVMAAGNKVFTVIFTMESSMKILAMSPKFFFQVGWNAFDFFIVAISLIEVMFEDANLPGLGALRSFRLLRVFKLAKSWPALNMILTIMGATVGSLTNLVIVLIIIIFIFAVMGMQLFAQDYFDKHHLFPGGDLPRWNFTDFGHSFMIIFRVLCGEWIESMWDCMLVSGPACVPFFLATVLIGNLVLLNLFLALLLSSFGGSSVAPSDNEQNKLAEAFDRIGRFIRWIKNGIKSFFKAIINLIIHAKNRIVPNPQPPEPPPDMHHGRRRKKGKLAATAKLVIDSKRMMTNLKQMKSEEAAAATAEAGEGQDGEAVLKSRKLVDVDGSERVPGEDDVEEDSESEYSYWSEEEDEDEENIIPHGEIDEEEYPSDCMPPKFYERFPMFDVEDTPFGVFWANIRLKCFRLLGNKYFETAVIGLILFSSLAMAFEDVHLPSNPILTDVLFYLDQIFTVVFFFEMLLKWTALGFVSYFTNAWCWLDFIIVSVSMINFTASLLGAGSIEAFKTLKTLRALRPLRAMAKMEGMRVVVNALVGSIPSITNVLLVCLIFWLIFAIMGVQLFSGKFQKCLDPEDESRPDFRVIKNKLECLANNFTWENSVMNFDHVGKAYLCLFQVATFKGWIGIMNDAIDSREIDEQPHRETSFVMYGYFVIFIIFGSFFTLNLFIGVIIDNFNEQQKKTGSSAEMFMTEDQKKYYAAMQKMGGKKPVKAVPKPTWKPQLLVFDFVINQKFDMVIMILIGFNMVLMMCDHYQMSAAWENGLGFLNSVFVGVFTAESCLKMFALRHNYFKEPWNLFDVVVVFMSVAGMFLSDLIEKYFVSPTLLRVVRVAKVGRVLRLIKGAKGIRTLLFALAMSLPALFNICLLLFLVMFIFAIFGMGFFMHVKLRGALDEVYNFQTFGQSIILLFQMSTSAGWDGVLDGIMNEDDCDEPDPELGYPGDCGSASVGIAFLLSYLVISFLVVINMYIAVILDNYSQASEDVQEGLTGEDYDMFYEIWAQFDPAGSNYIPYDQLTDLLDVLEPPLQIAKPNKYKIVTMNIVICKGDMIYAVDIVDALTKDFFFRGMSPMDEPPEMALPPKEHRPGYEPISTTLLRQREEYYATVLQKKWKLRQRGRNQGSAGVKMDSNTYNSPYGN